MNVGLLQPWLLLGALAVAVPIWLHLRRKPLTHLVRFPTLRFLQDHPVPRESPHRLQDLVTFLLRTLALLLVATAFAWPYRRDRDTIVIRESVVYVLDNTLSRQAGEGFARDRDRIAAEIARTGADTQVAVIELRDQPRVVASFSDPRETARQRVAELKPSFQRGSFLAAFRQANDLLARSLGERRRIVLGSDNQANQWAENAGSPPFLRAVQVDLPAAGTSNAPNVSLSAPHLQRVFLGDRSIVDFTVRLARSEGIASATVTLRANGQLIFSRALELGAGTDPLVLQTQWEADPDLWIQGSVVVEATPDALAADNRVFFSLPPVHEGRIALLAGSPYLRLALSPEVMRGHWQTRLLDPAALASERDRPDPPEVLVLESGYLQSADARDFVWRQLTNGRGVFLVVNRLSPAINAALRELGFEPANAALQPPPRREHLQVVLPNHPVFHPFLSPDYGNLLEVTFGQHPHLKPVQAVPLAFSDSSEPLFFEGTRFPGRLFVTAFGFEREQTSWPLHVSFVPFLDLALQNARPIDATPLDYEPGATAVFTWPSGSAPRELVLRDGPLELGRSPVADGRGTLRLPGQPGLYALHHDAGPEPAKILSVNPPPKESLLTYEPAPAALKMWQLETPTAGSPPPAPTRPDQPSLGAILQQRVWWWLLLLGLGALLLETTWTGARKRSL